MIQFSFRVFGFWCLLRFDNDDSILYFCLWLFVIEIESSSIEIIFSRMKEQEI